MSDTALQNLVGLQPDGIAEPIGFQIVEQFRDGEGGISPQIFAPQARPTIALHDWIKHGLPVIRAMSVSRSQRTAFQIPVLIEDEQRVITTTAEVAVIR